MINPAVKIPASYIDEDGVRYWHDRSGRLHRRHGPAVVRPLDVALRRDLFPEEYHYYGYRFSNIADYYQGFTPADQTPYIEMTDIHGETIMLEPQLCPGATQLDWSGGLDSNKKSTALTILSDCLYHSPGNQLVERFTAEVICRLTKPNFSQGPLFQLNRQQIIAFLANY